MSIDSAALRRWAYRGARYGPKAFVKHSPGVIGATFALGLPSMRARVRDNLRRVMGRRHRLIESYDVTRTFMNYAACLAEGLAFDRPEGRAARFRIEGGERLDAALAEGHGVILLTAHVGPFEAAARFFAQSYQRELMVVMHRETNAEARQFHDELRRKMGMVVVHVGEHALDALPVLTHLTSGGAVAMQLDAQSRRGSEAVRHGLADAGGSAAPGGDLWRPGHDRVCTPLRLFRLRGGNWRAVQGGAKRSP